MTFGLPTGAAFCVHPHSASHAWGWPDSTLGRDAERAPCTPPSPALGLAFGPFGAFGAFGAPYKKASFLCVSRWETLRPHFLYCVRQSDLTSCICGLWLSLGLSNLHGEKVPFVQVSADQGHLDALRQTLHLWYTCPLTNLRELLFTQFMFYVEPLACFCLPLCISHCSLT